MLRFPAPAACTTDPRRPPARPARRGSAPIPVPPRTDDTAGRTPDPTGAAWIRSTSGRPEQLPAPSSAATGQTTHAPACTHACRGLSANRPEQGERCPGSPMGPGHAGRVRRLSAYGPSTDRPDLGARARCPGPCCFHVIPAPSTGNACRATTGETRLRPTTPRPGRRIPRPWAGPVRPWRSAAGPATGRPGRAAWRFGWPGPRSAA
ncbi:MAG: hypothetical protein GIKADHBN_02466 [Phycisphaerales bacterium]|nr:hypothetical protein [Phycisphaerales bacterium]